MRDRSTLDFVRDRVLSEIQANPSQRPYLGEDEPRVRQDECPRGHRDMVTVAGRRHCATCKRERRRERDERRRSDDGRPRLEAM